MEPLGSPTEFRLAYLPPDLDKTATIEITLHHFDLDKDVPPYDVLLYSRDNFYTSILCNQSYQTELRIPRNAADALEAIRSRKSRLRYIWMSSVCINREDTTERINQFVLGRRITKGAETVVLWMGADDQHTPAVFELMERLIGARKSVILPTSRLTPKPIPLSLVDKYRGTLLRLPLEQWQWLDDFFDRRAKPFCRTWIAPNAAFTRSMSMMCGNFILRWAAVWDGLEAYAHLSDANNIRSPVVYTMLGLYTLREEADAGMIVSWGRLLEVVRTLPATDPHDTTLASIAWMEDIIHGISESRILMPTDYTGDAMSTYQYRYTGKYLIKQSPNEPFLSALSMKEDDVITDPKRATSSWMPDWGKPHTVYRLNGDASPFSASGCTSPFSEINSRPALLNLRGCIVDEVAAVGPYLPARRLHDKFNLRGANNIIFAEWYEWAERRVQSGKERNELILHWTETIQGVGRHIPSYLAVEIEGSPGLLELAKSWLNYLETEGEEETEHLRQFYASCLPAHGRRVGITRGGRFCLLPKNTVIGDSICIPYGSKVPFVFRKATENPQSFINIGECYIHGAMMGEAMDWDGVLDVEFILV